MMISLRKGFPLVVLLLTLSSILGIFMLTSASGTIIDVNSLTNVQNLESQSEIRSQIVTSIPSFYLTEEKVNQSFEEQILPEFTRFLAITMVEVVLEQNYSKIFGTEFTISLNGVTQTQSYREGNMEDVMQLAFILDQNSQLGFDSPLTIEWTVNTDFDSDRFWPIDEEPFHGIQVQYLKIITSPQSDPPQSKDITSPAIILPDELYSVKENSLFGFISTEVKTYIVVPEGINETHALNLTITTNAVVDYEFISSGILFLQEELPKNVSNTDIQLKVKNDIPEGQVLSLITIRYVAHTHPSEGLIMSLQGEWGFDSGSSSLIPTSDYDFPLFILATLIPVVLVSRLFWKRTLYP